MCVSVSLCVCEFDGATLAVWGQTSTWLRRRLLLLHLATSFASLPLLAACCMRIAFNRFRSVAARRARSDWGSRSASIRISCCACAAQTTSRRVDAARRSSKLLLLHCTAGLSVCVSACEYYVYVLCVRTACEVGILAGPVATKRGWVAAEDSSHDSSTNGKFSSFSLPTYVHTCMYCVYMYIGMCVCILRYFKIEEGQREIVLQLTISSTYIHTLSYETFMLMCSNFKGT